MRILNLVMILFPFLLLGCASLPQHSGQSKISSIEGKGKFDEINKDLTRASASGMVVQRVGYYAEATLISEARERARVQELCLKNLESSEKCAAQVEDALKAFEKTKCFFVNINTASIEWAKKEMWKIKVEQPQGNFLEGSLTGFETVPRVDFGSQARPFRNSGAVCYPTSLDFKKRIKMYLIPQFGGANAVPLELIWEDPKP